MKKLAILLTVIVVLLISACPDPGETLQPNEDKKEPRIATAAEVEQFKELWKLTESIESQVPKTPPATRSFDNEEDTHSIFGGTIPNTAGSGEISYVVDYYKSADFSTTKINTTLAGILGFETETYGLVEVETAYNYDTYVVIGSGIDIGKFTHNGYTTYKYQGKTEQIEYKNFVIDIVAGTISGEILYTMYGGETVKITSEQLTDWVNTSEKKPEREATDAEATVAINMFKDLFFAPLELAAIMNGTLENKQADLHESQGTGFIRYSQQYNGIKPETSSFSYNLMGRSVKITNASKVETDYGTVSCNIAGVGSTLYDHAAGAPDWRGIVTFNGTLMSLMDEENNIIELKEVMYARNNGIYEGEIWYTLPSGELVKVTKNHMTRLWFS